MCSKCETSTTCACDGGSELAMCACEKGRPCPVCEHDSADDAVSSAPTVLLASEEAVGPAE